MKSKLLILIAIIAVGIVTYFSYPVLKGRYFTENGSQNENSDKDDSFFKTKKWNIFDDKSSSIETNEESTPTDEEESPFEDLPSAYNEVTRENCSNRCEGISNKEEVEYCRQFCGISLPQEGQQPQEVADCSEKSGLERDYCYNNMGIKNKSFEDCGKIQDGKIKESCTIRVTELIMEGGISSEILPN